MALVTSVLTAVLAFFSRRGQVLRRASKRVADQVLREAGFELLHQSRPLIERAVELYGKRLDKSYSLTDCASMIICHERQISEILTHDHDFEQEGFSILL